MIQHWWRRVWKRYLAWRYRGDKIVVVKIRGRCIRTYRVLATESVRPLIVLPGGGKGPVSFTVLPRIGAYKK